jgi:transcriptional regulator with XRE-family HTH domain
MSQHEKNGRARVAPGSALKTLRTDRGWTLADVSERTGIPTSTLSKVENGKTDLTLDRLLRISVALDVNIADLFGTPSTEYTAGNRGRRSITRIGEGTVVASPYGEYCYHAQDLLEKRIAPIVVDIRARSLEEFGDYHFHQGEEYLLVLEGALSLYTDTYAPVHLKTGESIYFDSGMGHAYVADGEDPCRILVICASPESGVIRVIEGVHVEDDSVVQRIRRSA